MTAKTRMLDQGQGPESLPVIEDAHAATRRHARRIVLKFEHLQELEQNPKLLRIMLDTLLQQPDLNTDTLLAVARSGLRQIDLFGQQSLGD